MILKRESGQKAAEGADAAEETLGETKAEGRAVGAWCSCQVESPPTLTGLTSPVPKL